MEASVPPIDQVQSRVDVIEIDEIIIKSPDRISVSRKLTCPICYWENNIMVELQAEDRRDREANGPPGYTIQRQWEEVRYFPFSFLSRIFLSFNDYTSLQKSLKVSFDKLLSRQIQNPANLDEIIETRRNLFHRVKAKHVQLEMVSNHYQNIAEILFSDKFLPFPSRQNRGNIGRCRVRFAHSDYSRS